MLDGPPEISSDSERAPGARSIADEFSGGPSSINQLTRCEDTGFEVKCNLVANFGAPVPSRRA